LVRDSQAVVEREEYILDGLELTGLEGNSCFNVMITRIYLDLFKYLLFLYMLHLCTSIKIYKI